MEIKIDKDAARAILMALWDDLARSYNFWDSPRGGIYNMTDEEVLEWLINILNGTQVLSFMITDSGCYEPCTRMNYS